MKRWLASALLLLYPGVAFADGDAAAAEAAFAEARALIKEGRWEAACPKLEVSLALEPAVGTLLNLGECLAKTGRTASAWLRYREAASMAVQKNQPERERIARDRARDLEPRLCRILIHAPKRADLVVSRDGAVVDANVVGVPVPVDPGPHEVKAEAEGEAPFTARIEVKAPADDGPCTDTTVDVPFAAVRPARPAAVAAPDAPVHADEEGGFRPLHGVAIAAGALGLAGLGVGAAFGLSAASAKRDADAECTGAGCTQAGRDRLDEAGQRADVATVAFVAGSALLVTGVVLWLASPPLRSTKPSALTRSALVVRF